MVRGKELIASGFIVQSCHTQPGINVPFILGSYVKLVFGYPSRARVPQSPRAGGCFAWTPAAAKPSALLTGTSHVPRKVSTAR